jgi:chemotaxis protein MotB
MRHTRYRPFGAGRPSFTPRPSGSHGSSGHDRWLVSYADFITLLFAFFTTMYAISTVDAQKLAPMASSLQRAFDSMPGDGVLASGGPAGAGMASGRPRAADPVAVMATGKTLSEVRAYLARELADAVASGRLELSEDPRGLVLSLPEGATFDVGRAEVSASARELIARLAQTLQPLGNAIRIEGHTDDVPIHTARYGSNWELSTARASAVVAFLIETHGFAPGRLSAAGYGEFHPRVANDSNENRARNRRVDIVVLNPATAEEEPHQAATRPAEVAPSSLRGGLGPVGPAGEIRE